MLTVCLQIGKYVRSQVLRQNPIDLQHLLRLQLFHENGNVSLVHFGQKLTEIRVLLSSEKPDELLLLVSHFHSISPYVVLLPGCNFDREEGYHCYSSDSSCKTTSSQNAMSEKCLCTLLIPCPSDDGLFHKVKGAQLPACMSHFIPEKLPCQQNKFL